MHVTLPCQFMNQRSRGFIIIYQDGPVFVVKGSKLLQKRVSDATPSRIKCKTHWILSFGAWGNSKKKAQQLNPAPVHPWTRTRSFWKIGNIFKYWYSCLSGKGALKFPPSSCCQKKCQIIHKCSSESAGRNMVVWMQKKEQKTDQFFPIMSGKCSVWACCIFPMSLLLSFSCGLWAC